MNLETPKSPIDAPYSSDERPAVAKLSSGGVNIKHLLTAIVLVSAFAELSYTTVNMSAMAVYIQYGIKIDLRWIAICSGVFITMEGLLKSPMGILGDRYGRKILMVIGPMVSIFTALLTPHVANPYVLVFLRILDGIGAAALWPAAFSLIGDHVPENQRASAMSLFNLAYLIGIALGPAMGGGINDFAYYHLHTTFAQSKEASFYLASVMFAITTIIAFLMIPNSPPTAPQRTASASTEEHGGEHGFNGKEFLRMLARMPMTLLMTFITFLGIGLVMSYFKVFTLEHFHISESKFGLMMIGPALVVASLAVPMGKLGDKIEQGARRSDRHRDLYVRLLAADSSLASLGHYGPRLSTRYRLRHRLPGLDGSDHDRVRRQTARRRRRRGRNGSGTWRGGWRRNQQFPL